MNDLLAEIQRSLGPDGMQALSQAVGEDESTVERATSASVPLLLQALARNASTDDGAQSLYTALREDHDGSVLNDIGGVAKSPSLRWGGHSRAYFWIEPAACGAGFGKRHGSQPQLDGYFVADSGADRDGNDRSKDAVSKRERGRPFGASGQPG